MQKIGTWSILLSVITAGALASSGLAAGPSDQVILVREGTAVSTIVVGKNLLPSEKYAAQELQKYLGIISGAQIPIKEEGQDILGCKILLGTFESNTSIKALRNQLQKVESLGDQGFLITTMDGNLVIAGGGTPGVLYGVYTFLEKYLGCRWYFPGEAGEVVPKRATIQLGTINHSEQPSLSYRSLIIGNYGTMYDPATVDWMARNKMNALTDVPPVIVGYEGMLSRAVTPTIMLDTFCWFVPPDMYDKHPEYFPLINGKRVRPSDPASINVELCLSNPDVLKIVVQKTRAFLAQYPGIKTMGIEPNDNFRGSGWCDCPNCLAMGKTRTDQLVTFVNRVATEIHKTNPDKYVGFLAYSDITVPPTIKPLDNVKVQYVRNWRCYKHTLNDPKCEENAIRAREIEGWLKMVNPADFSWADYSTPWPDLPLPAAGVFARELKWFHELRMEGFAQVVDTEHWDMIQLNCYTLAKVGWDTNLTYEEILDEFCKNCYGPAAGPMKEYYMALDRAVQEAPGCFGLGDGNSAGYEKILTPQVLRELKGNLAEAERLTAASSDVAARVGLAMAGYKRFVMAALGQVDVDKEGGKNLVSNPGFEEGATHWSAQVPSGKYTLSVDETQAHSGKKSAKITCQEPGQAKWIQVIPVEKGKKYYFSAWVKTEGKSPILDILCLDQGEKHLHPSDMVRGFEVEGPWRKYVPAEITTTEDTLTISLRSDLSGTVWFDDIVLRKIGD